MCGFNIAPVAMQNDDSTSVICITDVCLMFVINTCNNSGENHGEKCVSVKVLINKDNFGFEGGFLVRVEFDFCAVKWVKGLIYKGLDDMGYDKGFEIENIEFELEFKGLVEINF